MMMKREKNLTLCGHRRVSVGVEPYLSRVIYKNDIITQLPSPENYKKLFSFPITLTQFFE